MPECSVPTDLAFFVNVRKCSAADSTSREIDAFLGFSLNSHLRMWIGRNSAHWPKIEDLGRIFNYHGALSSTHTTMQRDPFCRV